MTDLLSKDHRILEKGLMEYRPFGVDLRGEKIRDVSGLVVKANVEYLEEVGSRARGPDVGARAIEELARLLNERIRDSAYHVTSAFLKNPWNSYSYEFVVFLGEFCQVLSGDPSFSFRCGQVTVRVHAYPEGTLAVFHGQRCAKEFRRAAEYSKGTPGQIMGYIPDKLTCYLHSLLIEGTMRSCYVRIQRISLSSSPFH